MRLEGRVGLVIGAGQTPGDTIGNGRATALLLAREGAKLMLADRDLESARATEAMIRQEGGEAASVRADVTSEADCAAMVAACVERYGKLDLLQSNVGTARGDNSGTRLSEAAWDHILDVSLKGTFLACKHAVPAMRRNESGSIVCISSVAAIASTGMVAYKAAKAGLNAFGQSLALANARHGIRANVIMPGLMDTPTAIEGLSQARGVAKDELRRQRDAMVPLRGGMGTAWDVAEASLFLHSDAAKFITGVILPVDGGLSARIGR